MITKYDYYHKKPFNHITYSDSKSFLTISQSCIIGLHTDICNYASLTMLKVFYTILTTMLPDGKTIS